MLTEADKDQQGQTKINRVRQRVTEEDKYNQQQTKTSIGRQRKIEVDKTYKEGQKIAKEKAFRCDKG